METLFSGASRPAGEELGGVARTAKIYFIAS